MVVVDSYFYFIDTDLDVLVRKVDDGKIVFMYPLSISIADDIKSLQHDGRNFWTLHDYGSGIRIRRWQIENDSLLRWKQTFFYPNDVTDNYSANAFGVEHYITEFSTTVSGGSYVIQPDEYYDNVMTSGIVLYLGPNVDGDIEEVTISGVNINDVYLNTPIQYMYQQGDQICLHRSLFVFNNYDGLSGSKGTLFRFNSNDGSYMSSDVDVEYKGILAATFSRFQNILPDYPDAHALVYIDGSNAKLRNMSDLINVYNASSANDDFTGSDGSLPDSNKWEITSGDPRIYDNSLFCSTIITGYDNIKSKYVLVGDFDVQVSGSRSGYEAFQNSGYYKHFMKVSTDDHECEVGIESIDVPQEALVGEYLMETISGTNIPDTSSYSNDGTIVGSPTVVSGAVGDAIHFRGTSYTDGATLWPHSVANTYEDEFSLSLWFRSETTSGGSLARIITRDASDYWAIIVRQNQAFPQYMYFYY